MGFEGSNARLYGDGFELRDDAGGGNDRLVSRGFASDEMWGDAHTVGADVGTGDDVFVFGVGNGRDQINDFRSGEDRIDLTASAEEGIDSFEDVEWRIIEQGDGTLITLDAANLGGNSVFLAGVFELGADDFLLG